MSRDAEAMAEALLLAMDGDFLPGAGLSVGNAGQDIPFHQARPKEIAHWAAGVLAHHVAAARADALEQAADAWSHGQWADAPRRADRVQERIANAQHVGDWLRARAAALRTTAEEGT